MNTVTRNNIDTCALLAEINVSVWTARKLDRNTTDEVVMSKNAAAKDAARVNKHLFAGRKELEVIVECAGRARRYLYDNTLPWSDSGQRLLPTASFFKFSQRMNDFEAEFDEKVEAFVTAYPTLITAQAMALGSMFRRDEYPTPESIRDKFRFRTTYVPVPDAGDFRIDVGNDAIKELQEQLQRSADERVQTALGEIRDRLVAHLQRMSDRLVVDVVDGNEKGRKFHDTLVTGAYDLCETVKVLNITNDPEIEHTRRELEKLLGTTTADELRHNFARREEIKQGVDELLKGGV